MNPNEEKLINSLKHQALDHHPTLRPHPFFYNKYEVSLFYVDNHVDLLLTVRAMLYLAMKTIDPNCTITSMTDMKRNIYVRH